MNLVAICPRCKDRILEGKNDYYCRSVDCNFRISGVILGQVIHQTQVAKLLNAGRSDLLDGFISKSGKQFSAYLVMNKDCKIEFDFPHQEQESEAEPEKIQSRHPENLECKPLINAATRNLYRNNAFRITGLPIDATNREIAKHVEKLRMMAELGQTQTGNKCAFALNPSPTTDDIREAIQKLKDPEARVIDEFFWFWPAEFGKSQSDPAIQALAKNDSQTAHQIWRDEIKNNHTDGIVAKHNLAILWHLTSLESEHELLNADNQAEFPEEISDAERNWRENYNKTTENKTQPKNPQNHKVKTEIETWWRESFKYWEHLAVDDSLWEKVGKRIRQIDDARLTTGFHRRMKNTLPEALDKINAELALLHAEKGNMGMARFHIQFMRETNPGLDNVEKTADLILAPIKTRLRGQIQQTKKSCEESPETADEAARNLLKHARPLLDLFDLFYDKSNHTRNDLFDEIAFTVTDAAVDHQKKTGDNQTFVSLLEQALLLASSAELKLRINKNLGIGKGNIAYARLQPIYDLLRSIENSKESILEKLDRIKHELIPDLKSCENDKANDRESLDSLYSAVALVIRGLSIDANNELGDPGFALEIIDLASGFATETELKKKIAEDIKQITQIKQSQDARNVSLSIRDDHIDVTAKKFRYNSTVIPTDKITGIKFGVFTQYTNGAKTSVSYTIGVQSAGHGTIEIECKRFFRSEDQAKKDFEAILDSCFYHVIPDLVTRLANRIAAGHDLQIGDAWLTSKGIRSTLGILMWKEEVTIPWSDSTFNVHQGHLNLFSKQNKKFKKSYALRDVWNAVLFEQITKAFFKLRDKK